MGSLSGQPLNDAYRYVDWLLTVPLLLIELILVMGLPADQTRSLSWSLGITSGLMVALGYPDEIQDDPKGRWLWWGLAMLPFCYVLFQLLIGLGAATQTQPEAARGLIGQARLLTAVSWLTYPGVYIVKMMGIGGATATAAEQIGYSVADVVARSVRCAHLGHCRSQERCHGEGSHHGMSVDLTFVTFSNAIYCQRK